jgi:N-acetylglutamate synthase-like GNAT family acetyltransferase
MPYVYHPRVASGLPGPDPFLDWLPGSGLPNRASIDLRIPAMAEGDVRGDPGRSPDAGGFSERVFYLAEFRGRTLGLFLPQVAAGAVLEVLRELADNATRVVMVGPAGVDRGELDCETLRLGVDRLEGRAWRALRKKGRVLIEAADDPPGALLEVARRLGLFKVVRLADVNGLLDAEGRRRSFIDRSDLSPLVAAAEPHLAGLLREVEGLLAAGVPSVNLCTPEGLRDELFTYSGSGTLFTRQRYIEVRRFGIEDYDAADDLIARGAAEGYLAPRTPEAVDGLLADGFGAFVEGKHLAGIGALRVPDGAEAGEVASLYTLTRFEGEGVGAHLVRYAISRARELGLGYVYACTTSTRVGAFFARLGFLEVGQDAVPREKWESYDPGRRQRVACYRRELGAAG